MPRVIWGVDSAMAVDATLYECVENNFGKPEVWGRYLNTIEGVSYGLSRQEISFLKEKGLKILPVYNNFKEAIGSQAGRTAAQNAIYNANRLGIPEGVFIFANVERFFQVDAAWIISWVKQFQNSSYRPGFYNDPVEGPFNEAYCQAIQENQLVRTQSVLWSAEPEPGVTTKTAYPAFKPKTPDCEANVWAWQFGRDASECPIDTILVQRRLYTELY